MLAVHHLLRPSTHSDLQERVNIVCCAVFSLIPCKLTQTCKWLIGHSGYAII